MYKKLLVFITLFAMNTSLWAMDLNQTKTIISEAQEATSTLQGELDTLLEEIPTMLEEEIVTIHEINETISIPENMMPIEVIETNESIESSETVVLSQIIENNISVSPMNTTLPIPPLEINISNENIHNIELNSTLLMEPVKVLNNPELNQSTTPIYQDLNISQETNTSTENNESNISMNSNVDCTDMQGDSTRGLIIFKTRIKPFCDITGEKFAKQYTQEDWEDIFYDKEFKMEIFKVCPKVEKRYKESWSPHLYQFSYDYASDSDAIPEC